MIYIFLPMDQVVKNWWPKAASSLD